MYKNTLFSSTPSSTSLPTLEEYLAFLSFSNHLTIEMATFSYERTLKHQHRVFNNLQLLAGQNLMSCLETPYLSTESVKLLKKELIKRGKQHDMSKLVANEEREIYIYLNWMHYHLRDLKSHYKLPDGINTKIEEAIHHHWKTNSHHPEFHYFKENGTLEDNTEKISALLSQKMTDVDLLEMVADWMAVSLENKTSCKEFAKNSIEKEKRWPFSQEQKTKIFRIIDALEQALQANNDYSYQQDKPATFLKIVR